MSKQTDLINIPDAITVSGSNVGIGTTSPSSYYANHLVVDTGSSAQSGITIVSDTGNQGMFAFADGTSGDERYRGAIDYNHSNDSMAFLAAGGERIRIDSDGLKFHGDTAAANALSDYEEGTWTIVLQNVSSGVLNSGTSVHNVYTKIGRTVHLDGYLSFNNASADADAIAIGGLPFPVKTNTYSTGSQINQNGSSFGMSVFSVSGQTYLNMYRSDSDSSTGFNQINYNEVGRMAMHFSVTYITDS